MISEEKTDDTVTFIYPSSFYGNQIYVECDEYTNIFCYA